MAPTLDGVKQGKEKANALSRSAGAVELAELRWHRGAAPLSFSNSCCECSFVRPSQESRCVAKCMIFWVRGRLGNRSRKIVFLGSILGLERIFAATTKISRCVRKKATHGTFSRVTGAPPQVPEAELPRGHPLVRQVHLDRGEAHLLVPPALPSAREAEVSSSPETE